MKAPVILDEYNIKNNLINKSTFRCAVSMRAKLANACLRNLNTRRIHAFLYLFNKTININGLFFFVMKKHNPWNLLKEDLENCMSYSIRKTF